MRYIFKIVIIIILIGNVTSNYSEGTTQLKKGIELFNQQKYDEALIEFNKILNNKYTDENYVASAYIAYIYFLQHNYDGAIKYCNDALELNPNYIFPIEILGTVYFVGLKKYDKGIGYFYQAEQLGSETSSVYYNIACYYSLKKDSINALRYLDKSFFYGYRDFDWVKNDSDFNNIKSEKQFLSLIVNINSIKTGDEYCRNGDNYASCKDYKKAIETYQITLNKYYEALPEDSMLIALIYEKIGSAYSELGNNSDAILYFNKSLMIFKKNFNDKHNIVMKLNSKLRYSVYKNGFKSRSILNVQMGHIGHITSMIFSKNSEYLISGSIDATIKLWDVKSGIEIRTFSGHTESVETVAISLNNKYILSGSDDKTLKLWDIASGIEIMAFIGHSDEINSVVFSEDDKYILSGSDDKTLKLWDIASGREIRTFSGHSESVESVSFSPNGKYALSGSDDKTLKLWDIASGKEIRTYFGHSDRVRTVAFSPDGRYALSGSMDKVIILWDVESGNVIRTYSGHSDGIRIVVFSSDGRYIFSGSWDKAIKMWDIASGKEIKTFIGHADWITSIGVSPNTKNIISGSGDDAIKFWDIKSGLEMNKFKKKSSYVESVSVSSDSKYLIINSNNTLKFWNILSGEKIRTFNGYTNGNCTVTFSPDDRYVLSGSSDNTIKLWDAKSGNGIKTFIGHSDTVQSATFSPDNRYILSGSCDNTLKLWDAKSGKEIKTFASHSSSVISVSFSSNDKYILSGSVDSTLKLWDVISGKEIKTFIGHIGPVESVTFSPNQKFILSGSWDCTLKLWDIESREIVRTFSGHSGFVYSVAFSPNGKSVLSGSGDGTLKLWDVESGKEKKTYIGHLNAVSSVSFFPDGKYILSGSADGTTRIWNVETGAWVAFMSHSNEKDWLIFDSDGYWDSSRYGGELVAMVKGMDCWNIDQFAIKNNRPDLILAKLPNADKNLILEYNRQYKKRIAKLEKLYGIKESDLTSDMHVPKAEILKAEQIGKNMSLSIKLTDSEYDIISYNVFVNDVPVYTEIGKKISRDKNLSVTETIELTPGENKIEVSCFNAKGAESYRALSLASYDGKQKGNLYYIGFGVADYEDPTINDLKYSENDVTDLASKFSSMKNEYNKINIKTYTGKEVTATSIKAAKDFVKNASVDDTVILFISGHGMHDSDEFKTYYYLTQNTNMKNLKGTAADFDTVEDILAGINPRKKLFLMDTCDSGELDDFAGKQMIAYDGKGNKGIPRTPKGIVVDSDDKRGYFDRSRYIYNDLFRRTGAVVFSSSKGGEVSWEYDALKNGAFTEAMLDGLSGKADKDKNGAVSIDELQEFVSKGVINYTDDRQHPVIDRDNIYVKIELPVR